jgi:twitching motility protein PilU
VADLDTILAAAAAVEASDVYLLEGTPPALKVDGVVQPLPDAPALGWAEMQAVEARLLTPPQRQAFTATNEANLSYTHSTLGRFRVNGYRSLGVTGFVLRRVKLEIPSLETLDLPPLLARLALERQGLILVVGATGTGKSTTVAAMLDHRNTSTAGHIVTIEDPVEFVHTPGRSLISQREVGVDTASYLVGLQNALRQAPDAIFVGELRDADTVAVALHSAETGHLVLSTLHATNVTSAIERLLHFFPPESRSAVLLQLSLLARAIIAQRLVPRAGGQGRVAALEIMLNTARIQALIRRGETELIRQAVEEGVNEGLQTFDQGLLVLYQQKKISEADALRFAESPQNLRLRLRGIR